MPPWAETSFQGPLDPGLRRGDGVVAKRARGFVGWVLDPRGRLMRVENAWVENPPYGYDLV